MLMFRKYSPRFAVPGEVEAKRYARKLVWPGRLAHFLLLFPLGHWLAALVGVVLGVVAYKFGRDHRKNLPDFLEQIPLSKQLWLFKSAAPFLIAFVIAIGSAIGLTHWQGKEYASNAVLQWLGTLLTMISALLD